MPCDKKHKWARLPLVQSSYGPGSRTIVSCNNCLALKVRFETYIKNSGNLFKTHEIVVEQEAEE